MVTTEIKIWWLLTVPTNGLTNEKARRAWLPIVTRIDTKQQIMLRPNLSTRMPKSGEDTAEMV